jgi:hypothetical protein
MAAVASEAMDWTGVWSVAAATLAADNKFIPRFFIEEGIPDRVLARD